VPTPRYLVYKPEKHELFVITNKDMRVINLESGRSTLIYEELLKDCNREVHSALKLFVSNQIIYGD